MAPPVSAADASPGPLERYFQLRENGTDIRTECLAGFTTFVTLAYLHFVLS